MNSIKLISLAALATSLMPSWAAQKQNKPNIIFVISDDHSVPFLGCYGNKDIKTPNFDKFASEGMTFTRTYVTAHRTFFHLYYDVYVFSASARKCHYLS